MKTYTLGFAHIECNSLNSNSSENIPNKSCREKWNIYSMIGAPVHQSCSFFYVIEWMGANVTALLEYACISWHVIMDFSGTHDGVKS
jgi:hypothetical protein